MKQALYLGSNRVLTSLFSGEAIVVDARSHDALPYIMGGEIESGITPLFLRLLNPESAFVDVGANFGYYTLLAASRLSKTGSVYSFEANPHTFDFLQRSLWANNWHALDNVRALNVAVGDEAGTKDLYFTPEHLGGASLWPNDERKEKFRVPSARLDDLLPPEVVVDLVKIDVEGHEPYVLKGMHQIIARSPRIKIIIEFIEQFLVNSYKDPMLFQREISDLGLSLWKIDGYGELIPHDLSLPVKGANYCLLARGDQELGSGGELNIDLSRLQIMPVYRDADPPLFHGGRISYSRKRFPDVRDEDDGRAIVYGPYIDVAPGRYLLHLLGEAKGRFRLRVQHDFGRSVVRDVDFFSLDDPFEFTLPRHVSKFEISIWRTDASRELELRRIALKRL